MWKKSQFACSSYEKVRAGEDEAKKHSFNYEKLNEHKEAPKQRGFSPKYTPSSQQTFFVPPAFPVIPQKFAFFG